MQYFFTFLIALLTVCSGNAQIVNIPDVNFKNYLVTSGIVDTNFDGQIQVSEANSFTGTLSANNKNIADLTGIEEFTNLTELLCETNNIASLDVSNCSNLTYLSCGDNPLTNLNVFGCTSLESLFANFSPLNAITLLNHPALQSLCVQNNQLTALDLSGAPNLSTLVAAYNQITSLNITNNTKLTGVIITKNLVTSLDLSNHSDLALLVVDSNNLSVLNIQNGNNTGLFYNSLDNPNLACIQVDDVVYANANFTDVDATSSFGAGCYVGIDEENENVVTNVYPNPASNTFNIEVTANNLSFKLLNVTSKVIQQERLFNGINNINVSSIPNGFYTLSIYNAQGIVTTEKLIVAH